MLCAGAAPQMSPLQEQTWESFSQNWNVDVAQAFHWIRHALQRPLAPGSTVIAVSSGAAINGSPLSGGYAGAKATVRLITGYAALESERAGLGIDFVSVLPALTPTTELGAKAVAAYAERQGVDVDTFVQSLRPALTADQVGKSVLDIAIGQQRGPPRLHADRGGPFAAGVSTSKCGYALGEHLNRRLTMAFKLTYTDGQESDYDDGTKWDVDGGVLKLGQEDGDWTVFVSPGHWATIEIGKSKKQKDDKNAKDAKDAEGQGQGRRRQGSRLRLRSRCGTR